MATSTPRTIWRLNARDEKRFRDGHPWVYSNELQSSPKGIEPGEWVELRDAKGDFLALGHGNPGSLIAFRALSRDGASTFRTDRVQAYQQRLAQARNLRRQMHLWNSSCRWVFGEADQLSGLIVDRYVPEGGSRAVVVVQLQSAGMDRDRESIVKALREMEPEASVVVRRDSSMRKREGVEVVNEPEVLGEGPYQARFDVGGGRALEVDLLRGQKTGLFLDQRSNVEAFQAFVSRFEFHSREIRILDLCSYVGQWSQAAVLGLAGRADSVSVTVVDDSERALDFADLNLRFAATKTRMQVSVEKRKLDVLSDKMKDFAKTNAERFDIVICDPPALAKSRKDLPQGKQAYAQLNTQAMTALKREASVLVSCSCSALLTESDFSDALAKAHRRTREHRSRGGLGLVWVNRGTQSPDHGIIASFPEGRYLKTWLGVLSG